MQAISPQEFDELLRDGKAIPFDIRDQDEFNERHIPGAVMIPLSAIDENLRNTVQEKDAVFYCTSGMRTELAASQIDNAGIHSTKFLDGGINAWTGQGLPTISGPNAKSGLSLQRQVQITVGVLLLLLAAASWSGAAWSPFVIAAVGLGLGMAGLTGTCAMARVLTVMPWNRSAN